jgi:Flp pilus assembly protein TadG
VQYQIVCRPPVGGGASRRGTIVVMFAILLVALVGVVGLVIDLGLMMGTHRQAQNAADAAATAAAVDMILNAGQGQAQTTATQFVQQHNALADATSPFLHFPPTQGAYAGSAGAVEAIVTLPVNTFFIHILPGVVQNQTIQARAVATWTEVHTVSPGILTLDSGAVPGLNVSGQGKLTVEGAIIVNSEGGGVDENGEPLLYNDNHGDAAAAGQPNSDMGIYAEAIYVTGGVDKPENFKNIIENGGPILDADVYPTPDPFLYFPTPRVGVGFTALPANHEDVKVTSNSSSLVNSPDPTGENTYDAATGVTTLYPGLYDSIEVTGGTVKFMPGIYALRGGKQTALKLVGGDVTGEGVMFYNTGDNYDAATGWPDINDHDQEPPLSDGANFGGMTINASMNLSAIDTSNPNLNYEEMMGIEAFNGMLFYQRRANQHRFQIEGNSADGNLSGQVYAKWAEVKITGQGNVDLGFVVGEMQIAGTADITISVDGRVPAKAPAVYLVD